MLLTIHPVAPLACTNHLPTSHRCDVVLVPWDFGRDNSEPFRLLVWCALYQEPGYWLTWKKRVGITKNPPAGQHLVSTLVSAAQSRDSVVCHAGKQSH